MEQDCFNCAEPAKDRYTLVLESERLLEEKSVCDDCVSGFGRLDWMEIRRPEPAEADD